MRKRVGRKPLAVIDSLPYSQIIFLVASGVDYAQEIAKARKSEPSPTVKQLKALEKLGYLKSKKENLLYKTIYEVNWKTIINEFVKYIRSNVDYVCMENERLGMNLHYYIKGFNEIVIQARDEGFEDSIKTNSYLIHFLQNYYSAIGRLKEGWTITATFDFLSFFGNLNFIYLFASRGHEYYNAERLFRLANETNKDFFPEWLLKEKKPATDEEEFERYKKIKKHTHKELDQEEKKNKEKLDEFILKNKQARDLFILSRVLEVIRIKPTLQVSLNIATKETGKKIFTDSFSKEELQKYFEKLEQFHIYGSIQDKEEIEKDFKEILGENSFKSTKPTELKKEKVGNTNQDDKPAMEKEVKKT